jgi:hypothetical protein
VLVICTTKLELARAVKEYKQPKQASVFEALKLVIVI